MHPLLSFVLIAALVGVNAEAAKLHVHFSDDHRHAEHQHGLAAHHHGPQRLAPADELRIEKCDPAAHAVAIALCPTVPNHLRLMDFDALTLTLIVEKPAPLGIAALIDVRVHGPPDYAQRPLRAPPASIPA